MNRTLEKNQRLFHSTLWDTQEQYYQQKAQAAWGKGETPEFISSNAFTANYYANIIHAMLSDMPHTDEPFYLLDLGAGSGRFAYYFLLAFDRLNKETMYNIIYVLSDFFQDNLTAHQEHPALQPWFDAGVCDTALIDVTKPLNTIILQKKQLTLTKKDITQPLIVVANYLFCSLPIDQLEIDDDQVLLADSTITINSSNDYTKATVRIKYRRELHPNDTPTSTYFNKSMFANNEWPCRVRMPSAVFQLIDRLREFSNNQLAILCSDVSSDDIEKACTPEPIQFQKKDGNLWFPLDQSTLRHWHSQNGGEQLFFETSPHFFTALLLDGIDLHSLKKVNELTQNTRSWLTPLTAGQMLYTEQYTPCTVLKALDLFELDAYLIIRKKQLIQFLAKKNPYFKSTLKNLLLKYHSTIYLSSAQKNETLKALGALFYCTDQHTLAAYYLEQASLACTDSSAYRQLYAAQQITSKKEENKQIFWQYLASQCCSPIEIIRSHWEQGTFKRSHLYTASAIFAIGSFIFLHAR